MCSDNLESALSRIARFKRLICPMALHTQHSADGFSLKLEWLDKSEPPPSCLVAMELVFFVQLGRLGTREQMSPLAVTSPVPLEPNDGYRDYFGKSVTEGAEPCLLFSREDAGRPFLTANRKMWSFFEPELQKRLSELEETATVGERVRAVLLELLPGGKADAETVSAKLGMSTRTLQRKLGREKTTLQKLRNRTREDLARHYLKNSAMSGAEISFLLGFNDPNSFFRAFQSWTGRTPAQERMNLSVSI
jgi:AraC-like DNA-binding protein